MIALDATVTVIKNFDRVNRRVAKKERRVLVRTGAFARSVMRGGIRRRKGVSEPGNYPHAHVTGNAGLKLILFNVRPSKLDVIVGPLKFGRTKSEKGYKLAGRIIKTSSSKPIPQLINEGGTSTKTTRYIHSGRVVRTTHRYKPRPFRELTRPKAVSFMRRLMADERL